MSLSDVPVENRELRSSGGGRSSPPGFSRMIRTTLIAFIMAAGLFIGPGDALSQGMGGWRDQRPYGGYCRGPRWGWYGAKNPVKTEDEARSLLKRYFEGQDVIVGKITEREWYFEADIKDKKDNLIDRVIVDMRTGRIRSIF